MRYSWDFFADWLDNMAGLQMFKLKEKDDVSVTHMKQTGDCGAEKKHPLGSCL